MWFGGEVDECLQRTDFTTEDTEGHIGSFVGPVLLACGKYCRGTPGKDHLRM
jgi:hypothetical protein